MSEPILLIIVAKYRRQYTYDIGRLVRYDFILSRQKINVINETRSNICAIVVMINP